MDGKYGNASRQLSEEFYCCHFQLSSMENGYRSVLGSEKEYFYSCPIHGGYRHGPVLLI